MMQPEISRNIAELQCPARNAFDAGASDGHDSLLLLDASCWTLRRLRPRLNVQAYLRRVEKAEASVLR
jgi:hypothetical protein